MSRNPFPQAAKAGVPSPAHRAISKLIHAKTPKKKVDRRVRKTRDALGDALITLMQEKPFASITIQQVLDRAGVGRSTFYSHFRGKEDLFLSDVEDFFETMSTALERQGDQSNRIAPVHEFFAHVAEAAKFVSALNESQKFQDVFELGRGHFARGIAARLAAMPATRNMNPTGRIARAHALAGTFFSLLDWWLTHQSSATPQQMDDLFHQLVWAGLPKPTTTPPKTSAGPVHKPPR